MNAAINASSKLNGTAKTNIPYGKTPKFPITTHIKTKPTNQDKKAVFNKLNFFEIMKIAIANNNDHNPQIAPLIGSDGKTMPSFP